MDRMDPEAPDEGVRAVTAEARQAAGFGGSATRTALVVTACTATLLAALTVTAAAPVMVALLVVLSATLVRSELVARGALRRRPFEENTMRPTLPTAVLVVLALVVTGIGAVDAAVSSEWDLLVVLGLLAVLHLVLLTRILGGRREVPLRGDLVLWLRERSAVSGEPVEVLADRAVATYRTWYGDRSVGADAREPVGR